MKKPGDRLRSARIEAGFENAVDAARAYGWPESAYISHENNARGLRPPVAERYAKALKVPVEWILYEKGPKKRETSVAHMVPLVGYVGAGAETHFFGGNGDLDEVKAPDDSSQETVAVEIRGESLGALFDRWLVFYDNVQRPVSSDHIGRLCVVGLPDGRILIKKVQKSRGKSGLFHLLSNTEAPILDVEIEWAAKVNSMVPK